MNPEHDQLMSRRLQKEHDSGSHANPATEADFQHLNKNCPGCKEDSKIDEEDAVHFDHLKELHEDSPHPDCEFCNPYGQDHSATVTAMPQHEGNHPVAHIINHLAMSHDGSEPGCPLCERWGTNWIHPTKNF